CQLSKLAPDAFECLRDLQELHLDLNNLTRANAAIFNPLKKLVKLWLTSNCGIMNTYPLSRFSSLESLQELYLDKTCLTNLPRYTFLTNKRLTRLSLNDNQLTRAALSAIAQNETRSLSFVNLSNNSIESLRIPGNNKIYANNIELDLSGNSLRSISKLDLVGYEETTALTLHLNSNNISVIARDSFSKMKSLHLLDLSKNPLCRRLHAGKDGAGCPALSNLTEGLGMAGTQLTNLSLSKIRWKADRLDLRMMNMLGRTGLEVLIIQGNSIGGVGEGALGNMTKLQTLDMANCNIKEFSPLAFSKRNRLRNFNLKGNKIQKVSVLDLIPKLKHLEFLDISGNGLGIQKPYVVIKKCTSLQILNLSKNRLPPKIMFHDLSSLKTLHLNSVVDRKGGFNLIDLTLRNMTSLVNLTFEFNNAYLKCDLKNARIFSAVPSLNTLSLANNSLGQTNPAILKKMFKNLGQIWKLRLSGNGLVELPLGMFDDLVQMTDLHLQVNQITTLPAGIFNKCKKLAHVNVENNKIISISEGVLWAILPTSGGSLRQLDLSGNKWTCDCDIRWFVHWLRNTRVLLSKGKQEHCNLPSDLRQLKLVDFCPAWIECDNHLLHLTAGLTSSVVAITLTSYLIFIFRWDIKYAWVIRKTRRNARLRNGYVEIPDERYAAFVSYCSKNTKWIKDELLKNVEESDDMGAPLRLCIYERDFICGNPIVDNIEEYMNQTTRVVFVVTSDSLQSRLCDHEFKVAQNKLFEKRITSIIFILHEDVDKKTIPDNMQTMMRHTTCLCWPENGTMRQKTVFWKKIRLALLR
ncbi:toll-like receptor 4, partial [Lingula anatina]|uniref:Toll-like receptor 4 n=1 Tax=Lingula anatina TaxID=7574 RepID=A0A1S3I3P7_LINAN